MTVRKVVVGIDEVGRGAWAGPLVVGAIQLSKPIDGLADSKKLTYKKRLGLVREIYRKSDKWGLGWVDASEIDQHGLTRAMTLAIERALFGFDEDCEIVIDGTINYLPENPLARCEIAADANVPAVSAASILAKVARDNFMIGQAVRFPNYGFDKNVGYGTKRHIESLKKFGISPIHRTSYKPIQSYI